MGATLLTENWNKRKGEQGILGKKGNHMEICYLKEKAVGAVKDILNMALWFSLMS